MLNNKLQLVILNLSFLFISTFSHAYGDPTKPPASVKIESVESEVQDNKKDVTYTLNAIKIMGDNRLAIINNQQYVVGQALGLDRIKSISSSYVLLTSGKVLSLFDNKTSNIANKGY